MPFRPYYSEYGNPFRIWLQDSIRFHQNGPACDASKAHNSWKTKEQLDVSDQLQTNIPPLELSLNSSTTHNNQGSANNDVIDEIIA